LTEDGYEIVEDEIEEDEIEEDEIEEDEIEEDEKEEFKESDSQTKWKETYELCGQFLNDIS
jgi:hypothetical protein